MPPRPPLLPRAPWKGRRVVLAVTGGIACYKSVGLARDLTRLGAEVDVLLSEGASHFLRPLVFEGVTGRPVLDSLWSAEGAARHIQLAREAHVVVVAPATADLLARAAQGRSNDLIGAVLLATRAPVLLAPAMNDRMWSHPRTQANVEILRQTPDYHMVGPAHGPLAVGEGEGPGRLEDPEVILAHLGRILGTRSPWKGQRVLITAGPTREPLDAVRYLGNRSSGRMGYALAEAAWLRGAEVTLISGPVDLPAPEGVTRIEVDTAEAMLRATLEHLPGTDLEIHAAAVSDFRPEFPLEHKRKRQGGGSAEENGRWTLDLVENPDVARSAAQSPAKGRIRVGFALETEALLTHARGKLESKGFDWIVANPAQEAGAGFEVETNRGWILSRKTPESPESLPLQSKADFADAILDRIEGDLEGER